jgi:hypothetical protein
MVEQQLAPGMEHPDKTQPAPVPPLRILGEGLHGLVDRREQEIWGTLFNSMN